MKVGFIGLGRMGGHMCSNVIKAGFETYVSDLVPALVEQKVAEGAIGCKDNLEVAANMDIGFTMLPNGAIVEAVMCGPKGVLSHCKPGTIIVDMSSVAPGTTQKMAFKGIGNSEVTAIFTGRSTHQRPIQKIVAIATACLNSITGASISRTSRKRINGITC